MLATPLAWRSSLHGSVNDMQQKIMPLTGWSVYYSCILGRSVCHVTRACTKLNNCHVHVAIKIGVPCSYDFNADDFIPASV